ncbi:MAG: SDR family NAD(P)-dependent oxidoreductase [Ruminococcaceae bacterium]|nr:SDR family NAD(P)-dependent oxidoreductase [Oscillospiraceae bacterium]
MKREKWLLKNTRSLSGKTVAVTGTTGGIGKELCCYLAQLGANLILLDRNPNLSQAFSQELKCKFPNIDIKCINVNLEDFDSVKAATESLKKENIDIFIHNAGAYSIPRKTCKTGFDNVFQINFLSPYYIIRQLLPQLSSKNGRVVAVSSIAHNYSKIDAQDIDFKTRKKSSLVYGNAKRFLTFSLFELFEKEKNVSLSIAHPGISFTKITNHYPKLIFALIKHPMKLIFMKPKKACLSVLKGVFTPCGYHCWIGPRLFDIWGIPKLKKLNTCTKSESNVIGKIADKIYNDLLNSLEE